MLRQAGADETREGGREKKGREGEEGGRGESGGGEVERRCLNTRASERGPHPAGVPMGAGLAVLAAAVGCSGALGVAAARHFRRVSRHRCALLCAARTSLTA